MKQNQKKAAASTGLVSLVLKVRDKTITLSSDEAHELFRILDGLYGDKTRYIYPYYWRYHPWEVPLTHSGGGFGTVTLTTSGSTGGGSSSGYIVRNGDPTTFETGAVLNPMAEPTEGS